MGIIELVVAGVVIYFLFSSGALNSLTGKLAPSSFGSGLTQQQAQVSASQSAALSTFAVQGVGTLTTDTSLIAKSFGVTATSALGTAIPIIGGVIAAASGILLAQHTARLKGAIAENQLIQNSVNAFDNDIQELVTAYNNRSASASDCATAIAAMSASLYTAMKTNATGPGRSWQDVGLVGHPLSTDTAPNCDKNCTAECCVFWHDINPPLANLYSLFATGAPLASSWASTQVQGSLPAGFIMRIPQVYPPPSQYGNFSRPLYVIKVQ